ncbi:MAG: hypothetical protein HZB13_05735 [Acidobacteria bacterium]|nr:hypothetical protein [Acidobacteriota bacterium]
MIKHLYPLVRDLHLCIGLFLAPFVLVFSFSVFFLTHAWIPGQAQTSNPSRVVTGATLPANIETLDGRARVDALRAVLPQLGVEGEIGFVRHIPKQRRLVFAASVPGRETTVSVDVAGRSATITQRDSGIWDGLVKLHKSPGPHLAAIRMNWFPMRVWQWFADGAVYLLLFTTLSGVYLWAVLRGERAAGLAMLIAGALSFIGIVYAITY